MLNKVLLIGNLGRDPEVRSTTSGQPVASFSLATSRRWKDKNGQRQEQTEWHNIVCFGKQAEIAGQYLTKGKQIYVEGRIQTRSWDDKTSGEKKYKTEILVNDLSLLGGKPGGGEGGGGGSYSRSNASSSSSSTNYDQRAPATTPDYGDSGITDDDIPF